MPVCLGLGIFFKSLIFTSALIFVKAETLPPGNCANEYFFLVVRTLRVEKSWK